MKLLVFGGRDFNDRDAVFKALDAVDRKRTIYLIVEGGATGADTLAREWAAERGACWLEFPVTAKDWREKGAAAGPLRNAEMLLLAAPDGAVQFPGGSGTADMRKRCDKAGVKVWEPLARPTPQKDA